MEAAGYAVLRAANGTEALAKLRAGERIDLVVTDLSMPGMDGLALAQEAQRLQPGLPAIIVTGFATDATEHALNGALSGPYMLLRKPVAGAGLAERAAVMLAGISAAGG